MKAGDVVQVPRWDRSALREGESPVPVLHWIYARVLKVEADSLFVEIEHPANLEHSEQMLVKHQAADAAGLEDKNHRECYRKKSDVQKLRDAVVVKDRNDEAARQHLQNQVDRMTEDGVTGEPKAA